MVKRKSNPAKAFISKRQKNKKKEIGEKFSARELAKNFLFSNSDNIDLKVLN